MYIIMGCCIYIYLRSEKLDGSSINNSIKLAANVIKVLLLRYEGSGGGGGCGAGCEGG